MEAINLDQYFLRHHTLHPLNSTFLWSYYSANHSHRRPFYRHTTSRQKPPCAETNLLKFARNH
jgi:hypothetical protein